MHAFVEGTNKMEWEMDGIEGPDGINKVEKGGARKAAFYPISTLGSSVLFEQPT